MPKTSINAATLHGLTATAGEISVSVEYDPVLPVIELRSIGGTEEISIDRIRGSLGYIDRINLTRARVWVEIGGDLATAGIEAAVALAIGEAFGVLHFSTELYLLVGYVEEGRLMPCPATLLYAKY